MLSYMTLLIMVTTLLSIMFIFFSKKEKSSTTQETVFECGYTSYFFSHISVSMHYFMVGLIFLFLDLEMCFMVPFLNEGVYCGGKKSFILFMFIFSLLMTLIYEWLKENLTWKF